MAMRPLLGFRRLRVGVLSAAGSIERTTVETRGAAVATHQLIQAHVHNANRRAFLDGVACFVLEIAGGFSPVCGRALRGLLTPLPS